MLASIYHTYMDPSWDRSKHLGLKTEPPKSQKFFRNHVGVEGTYQGLLQPGGEGAALPVLSFCWLRHITIFAWRVRDIETSFKLIVSNSYNHDEYSSSILWFFLL